MIDDSYDNWSYMHVKYLKYFFDNKYEILILIAKQINSNKLILIKFWRIKTLYASNKFDCMFGIISPAHLIEKYFSTLNF